MKQGAIVPAPGLILADDHPRLRIDHQDGIAVKVRGIEQTAIGRECHIADEILRAALAFFDQLKSAGRRKSPVGKSEFKYGGARAAAGVHEISLRSEREP